jgi:L-ascorbate metabolism protein UlaG (beta-lactamase superfamily)
MMSSPAQLGIQLVGGPTAILEYGGLRWLTDPTLSPPGEYGGLTKLSGPALDLAEQPPIDVVLLSHHHHSDNLDPAGRAFLPSVDRVLSTTKPPASWATAMCSAWSPGQRSSSRPRAEAPSR